MSKKEKNDDYIKGFHECFSAVIGILKKKHNYSDQQIEQFVGDIDNVIDNGLESIEKEPEFLKDCTIILDWRKNARYH